LGNVVESEIVDMWWGKKVRFVLETGFGFERKTGH